MIGKMFSAPVRRGGPSSESQAAYAGFAQAINASGQLAMEFVHQQIRAAEIGAPPLDPGSDSLEDPKHGPRKSKDDLSHAKTAPSHLPSDER